MSGNLHIAPSSLLHNLKHNQVLHQRTVILLLVTEDIPHVQKKDCYELEDLGEGVYLLVLHFGFMDEPHVPKGLSTIEACGEPFDMMETTFFLGHELSSHRRNPG